MITSSNLESFIPTKYVVSCRVVTDPLFVGLPPLGGDAFFGTLFLAWHDESSLMSPMSDAAAPNVPPFTLSGASPSLHARHEEQHFLFLFESFEWMHQRHSHDEARRVADRSVGILLGGDWTSGEYHTIPLRGVYLNLHTRPPIPY